MLYIHFIYRHTSLEHKKKEEISLDIKRAQAPFPRAWARFITFLQLLGFHFLEFPIQPKLFRCRRSTLATLSQDAWMQTAPMFWATPGIPYTTEDSLSWPMV